MIGRDRQRGFIGLREQIPIVVIGVEELVILQQAIQVIVGVRRRQDGGCAVADQIIVTVFLFPT